MDEFKTIAKLWPAGTELNLGTDSNVLSGPYNSTRQAAKFVTDGAQTYEFLFWNTGRHVTGKRNVKWIFSVLGWGVWTATRWYGIPGNGPGAQKIRANAFSIGGDQSLGTVPPINGPPASTFPPNAWPDNGDDHVVSTANGPVSIAAKDPYNEYDFAGWLPLMWGGDDTGEYVETDSGAGSIGSITFYDHVIGGNFAGVQGSSAELLATYGYHHQATGGIGRGPLRDWIYEVIFDYLHRVDPGRKGDPSPMDRIRMRFLEELVEQARPGPGAVTDIQHLIEAAPNMSREELKRSMQSLKTTLELGKTALGVIEAQMKGK